MIIDEYHWISLNSSKCTRISMSINTYHWISLNMIEHQLISMNICKYQWILMSMNEYYVISMTMVEHVDSWEMGQLVCVSISTFVLLLVRYVATVEKGFSNMCVEIHEYQWISTNVNECHGISLNIKEYQWMSMNTNKRISLNINEYQWI